MLPAGSRSRAESLGELRSTMLSQPYNGCAGFPCTEEHCPSLPSVCFHHPIRSHRCPTLAVIHYQLFQFCCLFAAPNRMNEFLHPK